MWSKVFVTGAAFIALCVATGCSSATSGNATAADVCAQIEKAGIGENCVSGEGGGLAVAATEVYDFDLVSVPGEGGAVMRFDDADLYRKTVKSYDDAAFLAGPHRYGSENALIFVQMNEGLSSDEGKKVKELVDGL